MRYEGVIETNHPNGGDWWLGRFCHSLSSELSIRQLFPEIRVLMKSEGQAGELL
jgi:hypothetical protein